MSLKLETNNSVPGCGNGVGDDVGVSIGTDVGDGVGVTVGGDVGTRTGVEAS